MNKISRFGMILAISMMLVGCSSPSNASPIPTMDLPARPIVTVKTHSIDYIFAQVGGRFVIDKADPNNIYLSEDDSVASVHVENGQVVVLTNGVGKVDIGTFNKNGIVHEAIFTVN